jgi:hypothetical protein
MTIPTQCSQHHLEALAEIAATVPGRGAVVECGPWLGASTAVIADHLPNPATPIHGFDYFKARPGEVVKAAAQGLTLTVGQDTTPIFRRHVGDHPNVVAHKGSILKATWDGQPIELYVDDASKVAPVFHHAMRTFGPSFIPGVTKLVLLDFNWLDEHFSHKSIYQYQHAFMERYSAHFQRLRDDPATWLYVAALDWSAIPRPPRLRSLASRVRIAIARGVKSPVSAARLVLASRR